MKKILLFSLIVIGYISSIRAQSGNCSSPTSYEHLDINNVKARINHRGNLWQEIETGNPAYEIPKGSGKHSVFSGAIWIGGLDDYGQLKLAAGRYGHGTDFWSGPLKNSFAQTNDDACQTYDKHWKVTRAEVKTFRDWYLLNQSSPAQAAAKFPDYQIPQSILDWPGNGNYLAGFDTILAPFFDHNGDKIYNPQNGDYPLYDLDGTISCDANQLYGDQTIWWVINDAGNFHSETGGTPIGVEIQCQAFAFVTSDEINDMTFYNFRIINRSSQNLNQTYFALFNDSDLGFYDDDYVGCDVQRGLGYTYNGKDIDAQGNSPGPSHYGEHPPVIGFDFVKGLFQDNDGYDNPLTNNYNLAVNFSGNVYENNGSGYGDGIIDNERLGMRRFYYHSNNQAFGSSFNDEQCYNYMSGKNADGSNASYDYMFPGNTDPLGWGTGGVIMPEWTEITSNNQASDRRSVMSTGPFTFKSGQANDITIAAVWARDTMGNLLDGIAALQAADDKAQAFADNCYEKDCDFPIAEFAFQSFSMSLLFHYYGDAQEVVWDFGDGSTADILHPWHAYELPGEYEVCLTVKNSCGEHTYCKKVISTINYNKKSVKLKRIEGQGNGGLILNFTKKTEDEILNSFEARALFPEYDYAGGPVDIEIYNPNLYVKAKYTIQFTGGAIDTSYWIIKNLSTSETFKSNYPIRDGGVQYISKWGLKVYCKQPDKIGSQDLVRSGLLDATLWYKDTTKQWLDVVLDKEGNNFQNWIRSGNYEDYNEGDFNDYQGKDDKEVYEKILNGGFAPYGLTSTLQHGPAYTTQTTNLAAMDLLRSVDIVFTPDKSKWTKCVVIEAGAEELFSEGNALKNHLRKGISVDKNGNPDNSGSKGKGWFPGYAICLETGERLNMAFGENSALAGENGRDMIWNPTSNQYSGLGEPLFGGEHFVYVFGNERSESNNYNLNRMPLYDEGQFAYNNLLSATETGLRNVWRSCMWVGFPVLKLGHNILETETRVRLRVSSPYATYNTSSTPVNSDYPLYNFDTYSTGVDVEEIAEAEPSLKAKVFPNPFSEFATFSFENPSNANHKLEIYDLNGSVVRSYPEIKEEQVTIQKSDLNGGIYFYTLTRFSDGEAIKGKMVVF